MTVPADHDAGPEPIDGGSVILPPDPKPVSDAAVPVEAKFILAAEPVLSAGYCHPMTLRIAGGEGTDQVDATLVASGTGAFYRGADCAPSGALSSLPVKRDGSAQTLYFTANLVDQDFVAPFDLTVSSTAVASHTLRVEVRRAAKEVALGYKLGCALLDDGTVWCWGARNSPAIAAKEAYPGNIVAQPSRVADISGATVHALHMGFAQACVLVADGVRCWGERRYLGNEDAPADSALITPKGLDTGVTELSLFRGHGCAVKAGAVYCWGDDDTGFTKEPTIIAGFESGVAAVATGSAYVCAAMIAGGVKCRGANEYGQLGNGSKEDSDLPVEVAELSDGTIRAIEASHFRTCALVDDGLQCWGIEAGTTATTVSGLDASVSSFQLGGGHACAIVDEAVTCWGDNHVGQLGDDATTALVRPRGLPSPVTALSAGYDPTSCAIARGLLYCWGENRDGQLAVARDLRRYYAPTLVPALANRAVRRVSLAPDAVVTTCAAHEGKTSCWGANDQGALGIGNARATSATLAPRELPSLGEAEAMAAYGARNCAVDRGDVYCWGRSFAGQATVLPTKITLPLAGTVLDVCVGADHACALTSGESAGIFCWGSDAQGQLGDSEAHAESSVAPVRVPTKGAPTALACADQRTCAVVGGGVQCWGSDAFGFSSVTPSDVPGLAPDDHTHPSVDQVATAFLNTCARSAAGEVWCWSTSDAWDGPGTTPEKMKLPLPVQRIAAGSWTTFCASDQAGLLCWGTNDDAQVGNGAATGEQQPPTRVPGLVAPITAFATGLTSCAVDAQGMKCWGSNAGRTLAGDASFFELTPALTEPFLE